jgi:tetratricopeptide (TPR) repeat protein
MSGNVKFRWFLLVPIVVALLVVVASPVVSWAGKLEDAQERVRQNPNDADAHFKLGVVYLDLLQYEDAIAPIKGAIRLKPNFAAAHYNLGNAYQRLKRYQDAIPHYEETIQISPTHSKISDAHHNLGMSYRKLGHYKNAVASYKEAIRNRPNDANKHLGLGNTYKDMNLNQEAVAEYKEALRIKPDLTVVRNLLNELEQKLADERLAREQRLLIRGTEKTPSPAEYRRSR